MVLPTGDMVVLRIEGGGGLVNIKKCGEIDYLMVVCIPKLELENERSFAKLLPLDFRGIIQIINL